MCPGLGAWAPVQSWLPSKFALCCLLPSPYCPGWLLPLILLLPSALAVTCHAGGKGQPTSATLSGVWEGMGTVVGGPTSQASQDVTLGGGAYLCLGWQHHDICGGPQAHFQVRLLTSWYRGCSLWGVPLWSENDFLTLDWVPTHFHPTVGSDQSWLWPQLGRLHCLLSSCPAVEQKLDKVVRESCWRRWPFSKESME
jgi:hypothetical protein